MRVFWSMWKVWPEVPSHSNAHAKVKNWIFDAEFPGKLFEFGIILNDFWSSTIRGIQINTTLAELENPKNPGIQPSDGIVDFDNIYNFLYYIIYIPKLCDIIYIILGLLGY